MAILLIKADQLGLFDAIVPVSGSVDRNGVVRPPHVAHHKVAHRAPAPRHSAKVDLFDSGGDRFLEAMKRLSGRTTRYASGLSRAKDFATAAWAGAAIGVEIGDLSVPAMRELARCVVDYKTPIFVDSGAFGAFMKGVRNPSSGNGTAGLDFEKIFDGYDRLLEMIADANEAEEAIPPALLVMPDIVGDQIASLELIRRHLDYVRLTAQYPSIARPIIAIQKGPVSMASAYQHLVEMLGTNNFVVGIPSNAAAISPDEFIDFLREARPRAVHILGAAADVRLAPRLAQILESGLADEIEVTADANPLRSMVIEHGQSRDQRQERIRDRLGHTARLVERDAWIGSYGGKEAFVGAYADADGDRRARMLRLLADLSSEDEARVRADYGLPS